jgi:hypothetical protein
LWKILSLQIPAHEELEMKTTIVLLTLLLALFAFTVIALAANSGYEIAWFTIDAGGGRSAGGDYTLNGTIGQPEVDSPAIGGDYSLTGGFWPGLAVQPRIYLPLVGR